jgi:hypothetical protein
MDQIMHGSDHAWIGQHMGGAVANWDKIGALGATSLTTTSLLAARNGSDHA